MIFDDFTIAILLMMGVGVCMLVASYILEKKIKENRDGYPTSHELPFDRNPKNA